MVHADERPSWPPTDMSRQSKLKNGLKQTITFIPEATQSRAQIVEPSHPIQLDDNDEETNRLFFEVGKMVERQRMHKRKREGQDPSLNVIGKRAQISKPSRTSRDDTHIIHNDMSIVRPFPANNGSVRSVIDSVGVKIGHTKSDLPQTLVPLTGEDKT